ncbi:MAG: DUF4160 domain-containing protein [Bacteroidales bacterium]|nr:DUF4160 domain-containing protein [Bacteroidales bacterium]
MPTLFIVFGYKFFFWSNDHDPVHVHVSKGGSEAKYNVETIALVENYGFKRNELRMIESIIEENTDVIVQHWNAYFNKEAK